MFRSSTWPLRKHEGSKGMGDKSDDKSAEFCASVPEDQITTMEWLKMVLNCLCLLELTI